MSGSTSPEAAALCVHHTHIAHLTRIDNHELDRSIVIANPGSWTKPDPAWLRFESRRATLEHFIAP